MQSCDAQSEDVCGLQCLIFFFFFFGKLRMVGMVKCIQDWGVEDIWSYADHRQSLCLVVGWHFPGHLLP